ncbi:hypothetical protein SH668x_000055 [Planctomicrobium sp. SH668]|uniref:hypothetical protein n=1 Tax=Planctomicrobium sp. SH668 TaxID=3448126 RepID=UPI003F5BC4E4
MTLPRKHSHQIIVDGITYRWCLGKRRYQNGLGMGDRVIVELAENHGAPLVVTISWLWCHDQLTPRYVAAWIKEARLAGWMPSESGPPFGLIGSTPAGDEKDDNFAQR